MMLERQREGIAKAKGEGHYKGRKLTARAVQTRPECAPKPTFDCESAPRLGS
jgi:DNA invertase Pin-like site-specific DNA recombinase